MNLLRSVAWVGALAGATALCVVGCAKTESLGSGGAEQSASDGAVPDGGDNPPIGSGGQASSAGGGSNGGSTQRGDAGIEGGSTQRDAQDAEAPSCGGATEAFAPPVVAWSADHAYRVTILKTTPATFELGDNSWELLVEGSSGVPVSGLSFQVVPWMPNHQHGSVKTVIVTDRREELGEGHYDAQPINVNMTGLWEIRVRFPGDGSEADAVVFSFCVTDG